MAKELKAVPVTANETPAPENQVTNNQPSEVETPAETGEGSEDEKPAEPELTSEKLTALEAEQADLLAKVAAGGIPVKELTALFSKHAELSEAIEAEKKVIASAAKLAKIEAEKAARTALATNYKVAILANYGIDAALAVSVSEEAAKAEAEAEAKLIEALLTKYASAATSTGGLSPRDTLGGSVSGATSAAIIEEIKAFIGDKTPTVALVSEAKVQIKKGGKYAESSIAAAAIAWERLIGLKPPKNA
jgi:hypothetical protein